MTEFARRWSAGFGVVGIALAGCANQQIALPAGQMPPLSGPSDLRTTAGLTVTPPVGTEPTAVPKSDGAPAAKKPFELPPGLPGASAPPVVPPQFDSGATAAERDRAMRAAYPELTPVAASVVAAGNAPSLSLADLQRIAAENSPVLRRARADADAAYGQVIQAGLYPNPTIGYQVDQVQPNLQVQPDLQGPPGTIGNGAGQQGGFVNQLIKTAGKLSLARAVAGFDYINALVAVRRAEVDVLSAVRTQHFAVLVAEQGVGVNRSLLKLADEVYALQLRLVASGEAAGYEPLQLYAQAEQARNSLTQAEVAYLAAWKQLAAATGRPELPPTPLAGSATAPPPDFSYELLKARVLDRHTELLTARNTIAQAQTNLTYQRRLVIPDVETNQYHQYDNLAQVYQFGLQIGVKVPLFDRNQGNIRQAAARIARSGADLSAVENDLLGRLAEAFGRYETNVIIAARYRDKILPNLVRAYQAIGRRYQIEPDKVSFNDIVVAQLSLAQALQAYLTSLDAQWRAVVDVANLGQLDELYPPVAE